MADDLQVYATTSDLAPRWLPTAPGDADQRLLVASLWVAAACRLDPYQPPTDAQAGPLRDATCAQVAAWAQAGVTPGQPPPAVLQRRELDQGRIWYDTSAATAFTAKALTDLADLPRALLTAAGLITDPDQAVPVFTASDDLPSYGLPSLSLGYPPRASADWWTG